MNDKQHYEKLLEEAFKANSNLRSKKPYEIMQQIPNEFIVEKGEIYFKLACLDNHLDTNEEQLEFINYLLENQLGVRSTLLLYKASYLAKNSTKFKKNDYVVTDQTKHDQAKEIIIETIEQYPNYKDDIVDNDLFFEPLDSFPLLSDYYNREKRVKVPENKQKSVHEMLEDIKEEKQSEQDEQIKQKENTEEKQTDVNLSGKGCLTLLAAFSLGAFMTIKILTG